MENKENLNNRFKRKDDIIPTVIFIGVIGSALAVGGYALIKNAVNDYKESKKTQSLILIDNGTVTITDDTEKKLNPDVEDNKYSIVMFDETKWLIAVDCKDSNEYAEFIKNNVYFTDDDKIVLDVLNINDEKYEEFKENKEDLEKGSSRVRRG